MILTPKLTLVSLCILNKNRQLGLIVSTVKRGKFDVKDVQENYAFDDSI